MAALSPFRALRPVPAAAERVAAVPYDVVNTSEARELALGNPLSFLHVSRAEIDLPPRHGPARRRGVRARGAQLRRRCGRRRRSSSRRRPASTSTASRWARTCRPAWPAASRCDEYDHARDQEARAHPSRQGRRPDAAPDPPARADGSGLPDLPFGGGDRRPGGRASPSERPLFDFTAADGVQHAVWRVADALVAGDRRRRLRRCRRSTSPTATIARPAPPGRGATSAARRRARRVGHGPGGGVSRRAGADPAVQPAGHAILRGHTPEGLLGRCCGSASP